jgi:hypothetical protein
VPEAKRLGVVREEGELLVVSHGARLGGACVKCAAGDALGTRFEVLHRARPWTWLLVSAGVIGIVLIWFLQLTAGAIVIVLIACLQRTAGVVLPVCRACDARWRRAVRVRSWVALSLVPISLAVMGAFAVEARGGLPPGTGGWIAAALALSWAAAFVATRFGKSQRLTVTAASIDRELLFLRGIHPDARRAIVAESGAVRRG